MDLPMFSREQKHAILDTALRCMEIRIANGAKEDEAIRVAKAVLAGAKAIEEEVGDGRPLTSR